MLNRNLKTLSYYKKQEKQEKQERPGRDVFAEGRERPAAINATKKSMPSALRTIDLSKVVR